MIIGSTCTPMTTWIVNEPSYAVVIPFFNEAENVPLLVAELEHALTSVTVEAGANATYEVLLIDDGSSDGTAELLDRVCATRPRWRAIHFLHNRGQAAALYIGIHKTLARRLILLDGDGQNDPADIPRLLDLLTSGIDLVVGVRTPRRDDCLRSVASRIANAVRSRLLGDGVRDSGCGLKVMRREVVTALIPIGTLYSFIPALARAAGFRVAETVVTHRPRLGGVSKYSFVCFLVWPLVDLLGVWWFTRRRFFVPELTQAVTVPDTGSRSAWAHSVSPHAIESKRVS
jgi:glycosyltransferase involved in cell wall biosynthesis